MSENVILSMDKFQEAKAYWLNKLSGELNIASLATCTNVLLEYKRDSYNITFDKKLSSKILGISKGQDMALYVVLLTALKIMISKYTGVNDVVVVSPIYSMSNQWYNKCILLRDFIDENINFKELLTNIKHTVQEGYKNQHYPIRKLIELVDIKDNATVFKTILILENIHNIEHVADIMESPDNEITFCIRRNGDDIEVTIHYNVSLFTKDIIENIAKCFINIIEQCVSDTNTKLLDIKLVTGTEREFLVFESNLTVKDYPRFKTVHELFEEQVEKTPDYTAVIYKDKKLTYKQLNEKANQLALVLRKMGITRDSVVGIMVRRSLEMVIGLIAILKAGGAYLPIDPEYPDSRIKYIMEHSGVSVLLTHNDLFNTAGYYRNVIDIDNEDIYTGACSNQVKINTSADLAYIIYTSGSSGEPKGVMIEHKSLVNFITWRNEKYVFIPQDTTLQLISFAFDGFGTNFYSSLLSGGKLVIPDDDYSRDFSFIKKLIERSGVTNMSIVPSMYREILRNSKKGDLQSVRFVVLAGEKADCELLKLSKEINPNILLINEYGPTEACITTTFHIGMTPPTISIIGKPISNARIYILDKNNELLPIGAPGEICVSGDGLARGYFNLPEITKEKFISNPFISGDRIYKTGDMARWLPDGNIEFLGRMDKQVKIRGFRIELEEIEKQLLNEEFVMEAVVLAKKDENGSNYLCAYIVCREELMVSKIRESLSGVLPDYMIPAYFLRVEKMPLTPNGKIDMARLSAMETKICLDVEYAAPRNYTERKLAEVWEKVLGVEKVGINDGFMALGGDSIKAIQVVSRLQGLKLDVKDLLTYQTINEISKHVAVSNADIDQGIIDGYIELTPIQRWFFDKNFTDKHHWNQSIMLFKREGFLQDGVKKAFNKIAIHHDALRIVYKISEGNVLQYNRGDDENTFTIDIFDLTGINDCAGIIEEKASLIQAGMHLESGPLVKLGLFKTDEGDHLLIAIHHLIIDGVSWRIILEDFAISYNQAICY